MDKDSLLMNFVGNKLGKFEKMKFSIFAFLFGSAYFAYRKLLLLTIPFLAIEIIVSIFTPNVIPIVPFIVIMLIERIVAAIFFPKAYRSNYNKQVDKMVDKDKITQENIISSKGGKSVLFFIVVVIMSSVVTMSMKDNLKLTDKQVKTIDESEISSEEKEGPITVELTTIEGEEIYNYQGAYSIDNQVKTTDYFSIKVPDYFTSESTEYIYNFVYKVNELANGEIKVKIMPILGDYDAEKFAKGYSYYFNKDMQISTVETNDTNWFFTQTKMLGTNYNYFTNIDGKLFFMELRIGSDITGEANDVAQKLVNQISKSVSQNKEFVYEVEWESFEGIEQDLDVPEVETPEIEVVDINLSDYITIDETSLERKENRIGDGILDYYQFNISESEDEEDERLCAFIISANDKYDKIDTYIESLRMIKNDFTVSDMPLNDINWKVLIYENENGNMTGKLKYAAFIKDKVIIIDTGYDVNNLSEQEANNINAKFNEFFLAIHE